MHESYLKFAQYRYLKLSLIVLGLSGTAYALFTPESGASGSTAVGYALGSLSAALIAWLMALGIRKRTYRASGTMLREWLSAHVYLGLTLLLLVPLHAGFKVGWNVHTLAYALICLVIVSGTIGVLLYGTVPRTMTENRPGEKLSGLLEQVGTLDLECKTVAAGLPDVFAQAVLTSVNETRIGEGVGEQLAVGSAQRGVEAALERVRQHSRGLEGEPLEGVKRLIGLLALKRELVERIQRDVRFKALLDFWLVFHVPLAFAATAALVVHVVVVFYYR